MRALLAFLLLLAFGTAGAQPVVVGSKRFTESYILGEIATQVLQASGHEARHRQGLGNTAVMEQALATGGIDLYPEYTGTIVRELLKREEPAPSLAQINAWLAPRGLKVGVPLGFNNSYAIAMREDQAARLDLRVRRDGRNFFPRYDAVLLMRAAVDERPLAALAGRIDENAMRAMNGAVEIDGRSFEAVAREFLAGGATRASTQPTRGHAFLEHLFAPDLPR